MTTADETGASGAGDGFRSGFVTLTGRPNVGKSTLLNQMLDTKVSIVSDKSQTTRHQIRGVLNRSDAQIVFVDTPGVSKPRSALGSRLNESAAAARSGVDVVCLVLDARSGVGRGDRFLAEQLDPATTVAVLNKVDGMKPEAVAAQLAVAAELDLAAYFPVSAFTGRGVKPLVDHLLGLMPEGPQWYPGDQVSDMPEPLWVAELVREQLLHVTRQEVPHSVATRVTEWEWPRIRVEILVERDSQKGIVIGKGGQVLKDVGSRVRRQLPPGAFIELFVTVDPGWQHDPAAVERLGY
ncbi:MAG: GTPase Era [Acidimicrobiales bacterium]